MAAALAFFAVFAGGVTLAVGSAVGSMQLVKIDRAVVSELDALLAEAASASWEALSGSVSYDVPHACTGAPSGWMGTSCVVVAGRDLTVEWGATSGTDGSGSQALSYIDITATTTLGGRERSQTRRVWGPTPEPPLIVDYASTTFSTSETSQTVAPSVAGGSGSRTFSYTGTLPPEVVFDTATGAFTGPAAWYPTGSLDGDFTPGTANSAVTSLAVQSDGKVVIAGTFTSYGGTSRDRLARLNADGTVDTNFSPPLPAGTPYAVAVSPFEDRVYVGGANFLRVFTGGDIPSIVNTVTFDGPVRAIVAQPDGQILVGGEFSGHLRRVDPNGTTDPTFSSSVGGIVYSMALQPDGKIVLGGEVQAGSRYGVIRVNSDGSTDSTFLSTSPNTGTDDPVTAVAVSPTGKIAITGEFSSVNGTSRNMVAQLNADGTLDTAFTPADIFDSWGSSMAYQPDGKLLIAGDFSGGLFRLNTDGSADTSFDTTGSLSSISITGIAVQTDTRIVIAGTFTVDGVQRRVARFSSGSAGWPSTVDVTVTDVDPAIAPATVSVALTKV